MRVAGSSSGETRSAGPPFRLARTCAIFSRLLHYFKRRERGMGVAPRQLWHDGQPFGRLNAYRCLPFFFRNRREKDNGNESTPQ